jgi:hypothetical protein
MRLLPRGAIAKPTSESAAQNETPDRRTKLLMPKYLIERNIPNLGKMSPLELRDASAKSCRVLHELGPEIQWVQSYLTDNKLFCIYNAPSPELIRDHAVRSGFPADNIYQVKTIIDPTTSE